MNKEGFQHMMCYVFTFIEKEKQVESIVEKLSLLPAQQGCAPVAGHCILSLAAAVQV
jgi:hypothetical protein